VSIGDYMISMGCVVSVCSLTSNNALHSFCRVLRWVWAFCWWHEMRLALWLAIGVLCCACCVMNMCLTLFAVIDVMIVLKRVVVVVWAMH